MPRLTDYYQNTQRKPRRSAPASGGLGGSSLGGVKMTETTMMPKRKQAKRRGQMKALGGASAF